LEGVERTRACDVYERAVGRAWRDWRMGRVVCVAIVGWVVWWTLFLHSGDVMLKYLGREYSMGWMDTLRVMAFMAAGVGWYRVVGRMYVAQLRRLVRAELGTHCRRCGYDLRGTPDLPPPAVTRCPECGRVVPRDVHRVVLGRGRAAHPERLSREV
jgi:hypothetical protein